MPNSIWLWQTALLVAGLILSGCGDEQGPESVSTRPVPDDQPTAVGVVAPNPPTERQGTDVSSSVLEEPVVIESQSKATGSDEPIDEATQTILDGTDEDNIENLLPLLKHTNPAVRRAAVWSLYYIWEEGLGSRMVEPLAELLKDPDVEVRRRVASIFEGFKTELLPVFDELMAALNDEDKKVFEYTCQAIGAIGEDAAQAVPTLTELLKSEDYDHRKCAAEALGLIGKPAMSALPELLKIAGEYEPSSVKTALGRLGQADVLIEISTHEHEYQREEAATGLGYVSPTNDAVIATLARLVEDKDEDVRRAATEALAMAHPTTEAVVTALGKAAKDEDESVRERAMLAINRLEPRLESAVNVLLTGLKDKDEDVRQYASRALGYFKSNPKARITGLLIAAMDTDEFVRSDASGAIQNSAEEALPVLKDIVLNRDEDEALRTEATYMLGLTRHADEKAVATLMVTLLSRPDESVSVKAYAAGIVEWLELSDPSQFDALTAGLQNGLSAQVKSFSAQHLGFLKDPRAVPLLIAALESTEKDVAPYSAAALGMIREPAVAAVPALCRLVEDETCEFRSTAADALGGIAVGGEISLPVLLNALTDKDDYLRREAAHSIGQVARKEGIDFTPAVAALAKVLSDDGDGVAKSAAESLEWLGPKASAAVPELIDAMASDDYFLRWQVADALGSIGAAAEPAIPVLITATDDEDDNVQRAAVEALGDIALQPDRVVPVLAGKVSDPAVDTYALVGLQQFGPAAAPATRQIIQALKSGEEYYTRCAAAETLTTIGDNSEVVRAALTAASENDENETVREDATEALAKLSGTQPDP